MDEIEKVVKELFGRKSKYSYGALSPGVRDMLEQGNEMVKESFRAQVEEIFNKDKDEPEDDR